MLMAGILFLLTPDTGLAIQAHQKLTGPFASVAAANKSCVQCHEKEDADLRKTVHWTWLRPILNNGRQVLNDLRTDLSRFGLAAATNPRQCFTCHISAMPDSPPAAAIDPQGTINCLACHDSTGQYQAGVTPEALGTIVRQAGLPTTRNCRVCHDRDCDLTPEETRPDSTTDIHIRRHGFTCQKCHPGQGVHAMPGKISSAPKDNKGSGCSHCHGSRPHNQVRLNRHGRFVGCQSCHIPAFGTGNPVVLGWNWLLGSSGPTMRHVHGGLVMMDGFLTGRNIRPRYFWDDGSGSSYSRGRRITTGSVILGGPGPRSPQSRIMPFRTTWATQLKDRKYHYLLSPHLRGENPPFWSEGGLNQAITSGMAALRLPFSGETAPVISLRYARLNHGVVQSKDTLDCMDCHGGLSDFAWQELGYREDPWQDQVEMAPEKASTPPPRMGMPPIEESVLPTFPGQ